MGGRGEDEEFYSRKLRGGMEVVFTPDSSTEPKMLLISKVLVCLCTMRRHMYSGTKICKVQVPREP